MSSAAKKVLEAALANMREERVDSPRISSTPEWKSEIARRLETIENGEAIFHDAEEHLRSLRVKHCAS